MAKLKYYDFCCTARCEVDVTKAGSMSSEVGSLRNGRARSLISFRNSQVRARESSVERSQRLAQQNMRTSELRARESGLERPQRLQEQNIRTSDLRERESSVERSQRLAEQSLRTSEVERSQRLAEQSLRTSELRVQESWLERSQRLHEQNIRTSQLREREWSVERLQRLTAQAERQQLSTNRVRKRILANSNRLAFRYDPQVDYAQTVQIGVMNKICSNCSAKKWEDELIVCAALQMKFVFLTFRSRHNQ
ncbi:hypothetical protein J6590_104901 [Homalodisca vitripennis]|nr:hypothetical protein J6590_104901 [Homalodisca vitripennis]